MRLNLAAIVLLPAFVPVAAQHAAGDDPPPILLPDHVWVAEAGEYQASQPSKTYAAIEDALKVVPAGVLPVKPEQWTVAKVDAANAAFYEQVKNHRMRARGKIAQIDRWRNQAGQPPSDYQISYAVVSTPVYKTSVLLLFLRDSLPDLARLKVGEEVEVEGMTITMGFEEPAETGTPEYVLKVELANCYLLNAGKPAR